jgi:uncharacterized protein with GYD domain
MARYVSLINWTDQGVRDYRDTVDRYEAAKSAASAGGASFVDAYWTVGGYDLVVIVEAPDDETATAALLRVGAAGNIRTTTLRAFDAGEMRAIIARTA